MGSLCYTFQLYFDFSGYSDMAIGLGLIFGVMLPINFNSPYKATSIVDFWRRWHITLSHFLRDYLYVALGGNRKGKTQKYINLYLTMFLGGLWHGAGWTFVMWGSLHGAYLIINHGFRYLCQKSNFILNRYLAQGITFFFVVIAWVFFRANSFNDAISVLKAMFTLSETTKYIFKNSQTNLMIISAIIAFTLPNTQQFVLEGKKLLSISFKLNRAWSLAITILLLTTVYSMIGAVTEFLYFQF
jgi:alginate O-acetyltransferase complex protein AlgI